jgi:hypothetical protein
VHESERNRLESEGRRLRLAESDMQQAAAAAEAIQREPEGTPLRRALETALLVCYARPFTSNKIGALGEEWAPTDPEGRALHHEALRLRHKAYAHSDPDSGVRDVEDRGYIFTPPRPVSFTETHRPTDVEKLPAIIGMIYRQEGRFYRARAECEAQLGESG